MHSSCTLSLYIVLMNSSCTLSLYTILMLTELYSLDALAHRASTQSWCTHCSQAAQHGMTHTEPLHSLNALISHTHSLYTVLIHSSHTRSWCTHLAHRASTVLMHSSCTQSLYTVLMPSSRTQSLYTVDALISHTEPLQSWYTPLAHRASTQSWCIHRSQAAPYGVTLIPHSLYTKMMHSPQQSSTTWCDFDPTQSLYTKILMLCCYMACRCVSPMSVACPLCLWNVTYVCGVSPTSVAALSLQMEMCRQVQASFAWCPL